MKSSTKSKIRVRAMILDALSYGVDGKRRAPTNGAIFKLLRKLDTALDFVPDSDIDGINKLAATYLKLAQLAMPTAAQAEALDKGLIPANPLGASAPAMLDLIEAHLEKRRALLANAIPTKVIEIESRPNLSELARVELSKRRASSTPPPAPGPGGVVGESGDRVPTVSPISPIEPPTPHAGTREIDEAIEALPRLQVDEGDLDFSE